MMLRLLAALGLMLACTLGHASAAICPDQINITDTVAHPDPAANGCPPFRTGLGVVNVGETSATLAGVMDAQGAGSTVYHWTAAALFPPGCTSLNYIYANLASADPVVKLTAEKARQKCMLWPTIVSGVGAVSSGYAVVSAAGSYTVPITGVIAGTTYYTQELAIGAGSANTGRVSVMSTQSFTTQVAATGQALTGQQRFVKDDGLDSNDGLTDATAKLTLAAGCPGSLAAGTDCNLKTGDTWSESMTISHAGLSDNYSVIRCYKMVSATPYECGSGDTKPIILGTMDQTKLTNGTEDYRSSKMAAEGVSIYSAGYTVSATADYSEHKYIEVRNVRHGGIRAAGNTVLGNGLQGATGDLHHIKFTGMKTFNSMYTPIIIEHSVSDVVVRDSEFSFYNTCEMQRFQTGVNTDECNEPGWPGGMSIPRGVTRILFENNYWHNGFGEGTNCYLSPNAFAIFRGNRVSNVLSGGHYDDVCTDSVTENNIFVGNRGAANGIGYTSGAGNEWGAGLYGGFEDINRFNASQTERIVWRNNLSVGVGTCQGAGTETVSASAPFNKYVEVKSFGNTCVDPVFDGLVTADGVSVANNVRLNMQNNVVWSDLSAAGICRVNGPGTLETFVDNHWSTTPSDTDCNGAGDTSGAPGLTVSTYATWEAYAYGNMPTFANAAPTGGAAIKDTCTHLNAAMLTAADFGFALDNMAAVLAAADPAAYKANWVLQNVYDANDTVRTATCSKGAVE